MPINRQSVGQKTSSSSRLTSSTISSSAKCRSDANEWKSSNEPIMKRTTNLTRTRSLRLPQRSRDQYLMSGHLMYNNTTEDNHLMSKGSATGRPNPNPNPRPSTESWSPQLSSLELSLNTSKNSNNVNNNVTKRSNQSFGLKEALIPKFVRNSFAKLNRTNGSEEYNNSLKAITPSGVDSITPSSPMSNSSRDSLGIGINGHNLAQNYLSHLRKLSEEHERLQMEYSRLRLQLMETTAILPNKLMAIDDQMPTDIGHELKKEKSLANNYKLEILRLQEDMKRLQRRYWENIISQKAVQRQQTNGLDIDSHSNNSSNSQNASLESVDTKQTEMEEKIIIFENKIKELENETKEGKESIDFLTSERSVLAESLKEAEESLLKERMVWIKEKEAFEEVKVWSKRIYDKLKEKSEKLNELEINIKQKDEKIEKLVENNKLNEELISNSCKLLNTIRAKMLTEFTNKRIDNSLNAPKLWPQFDSSNLKDFHLEDNNIEDIFSIDSKEVEDLKRITNELMKENVLLKRDLNVKESVVNEKNEILELLKTEKESNLKKFDLLSQKYRCSESVNKELKNIIEKSDEKCLTENMDSLRLEVVGLKESLAIKDEMIEKLSAKYTRNRKVWEENEQKATQEIKKLDQFVDHVIETLKALPENYKNCEPIHELLEIITDGHVLTNSHVLTDSLLLQSIDK